MKIYLHGNCQTTVIKKMLDELDLGLDVKSREIHVIDVDKDMDEYSLDVAQADFIVTQSVKKDYRGDNRLSSQWIAENKSPSAQVITFPSTYFQGYTPSIFYLRPHDAFGMPYHDLHIVDFVCAGLSVGEITAQLTAPDFLSPAFVLSEMMLSIAELRKREGEIDLSAATIIEDCYQKSSLFHTVNHPSRSFFYYLLPQLLDRMGIYVKPSMIGPDYLVGTLVPPCVSVVRGLNLTYCNPFSDKAGPETYRCAKGFLSRQQYIAGVVEHYSQQVGAQALVTAVRENTAATAYLARFKAHASTRKDASASPTASQSGAGEAHIQLQHDIST